MCEPRDVQGAYLADVCDEYAAAVASHLRDARNHKRILAWWSSRLGDRTTSELTVRLLAAEREALLAGASTSIKRAGRRGPATVNRYMEILGAALNHAYQLQSPPIATRPPRLRALREPPPRVRFLGGPEAARLLDACKSRAEYLPDLVLLALSTGMRRGELLALKWCDVSARHDRITLEHPKNTERRIVHLPDVARSMLRRRRRRLAAEPDGLVFPGTGGVWRAFKRAAKDAGLKDFRFHDLRHTTASWLAMAGRTALEIADVLGHKTLAMVKRYAHLAPSHSARILNQMWQVNMSGLASKSARPAPRSRSAR